MEEQSCIASSSTAQVAWLTCSAVQAAASRAAQLAELMGDLVEGRALVALHAAAQLTRLDALLKGPACAACFQSHRPMKECA